MKIIKRWTPSVVGPPVGQYSHLAYAPAERDLLFISGQIGTLPDGTMAGPDAEAQSRQISANIEALLEEAGSSPADLVKIFTMVAAGDHVAGVRAGRADHFARWFPEGDWPTQSLVVVTALAAPEIVVEVEAVAAVSRR